MIFNAKSMMKKDFRRHELRISNGIESYHQNLYRFITKGSHLSQALREIIKVSWIYSDEMLGYYNDGVKPNYGSKKRSATSKKLNKSFYELSDSRAPDTLNAIYRTQSSSSKKKKVVEKASSVNQGTNFYNVFGVVKDNYDIADTDEYIQVDETTVDLEDMIFTGTMEKEVKEKVFNGFIVNDPSQDIMGGEDYVDTNDISDNESVKSVESVDSVKLFEELYAEGYVSESDVILMRTHGKSVDFAIQNLKQLTYQDFTRKYDEGGRTRPNRTKQPLHFYSHISINTNNSCFIDATFELLWNSVFPAIDFSGLDFESDDIFDQIEPQSTDVLDTKHCLTRESSSMAREFIRAIPKTKGTGFQYPRGE
ncbi:uncharacterized protein EV154DRAFT_556371 [Mucor mucedo]|uniref:uncharacterized protein n=1 Tax=Mucor mucedo TaxID=29922 RepID=UPI00221EE428|nr:uncharacterized protein EV154DRAFT_556371 [Mucor mucedo]KAI7873165.1 hypothetical protein EV154DRAFT_556371 [Mucor mucedo]